MLAIGAAVETIVRENWLTQRLDAGDGLTSLMASLALILGCFVFWSDHLGVAAWISANPQQIFEQHQYWRLWTTLFAHADMHHLLSNTFLFFILGALLCGYFGALVFPFVAVAFGGVINWFVLGMMPPDQQLIGMSGVVYWMGGFWLTLYLLLDSRRSWSERSLRSIGVGLAIFMPTEAFSPQISYASHGIGFLFGVLFGLVYFMIRKSDFRSAVVQDFIYDDALTDTPVDKIQNPS
jgi:rhomboid protease GluP